VSVIPKHRRREPIKPYHDRLAAIGIDREEWYDSQQDPGPYPTEDPPPGLMWMPTGLVTRLLAQMRLAGQVVSEAMALFDLATRDEPLPVAQYERRWGWSRSAVRRVINGGRPRHYNSPAGFVYVIGPGDGPVKVGFSTNPDARLRSLQNGSGAALSVLHVRPGTRRDEADLHKRLRPHRVHGEWFERQATLALLAT